MDCGGLRQLGDCFAGVFVSGACQPHRSSGFECGRAKGDAGGDHAVGVCALLHLLSEGAAKAGLSLGGVVFAGGGVFYISQSVGVGQNIFYPSII